MSFVRLLPLAFLLSSSMQLLAQRNTIAGQVKDARSGIPLAGATITNKTGGMTTASNAQGNFIIAGAKGDIIEISMVGYALRSFPLTAQSTLQVDLEPSSTNLAEVVLVGSRRTGRIKTETAVPVDLINVGQISISTARTDITSILNYAAPSFNYNKQTGSDGADHIDLATLRGLGPDQTLVLINGKRRHQTAFVAVYGTRGRGNSGTDLSAIPASSIERVEILRDGASAQYGSDAIAGVINLILKRTTGVLTGNINYSGYYDKKYNPFFKKDYNLYEYASAVDGQTLNVNLNYGIKLGASGFMNLTGTFISQGKTFRQALDRNEQSKDFMYDNIYRRAHGDGSQTGGGLMMNLEVPLSSQVQFYSFGGFNYKKSDAFAFTRNWSARPDRFPTNSNGQLIFVPTIMRVTADDTVFNPHIQTQVSDLSLAVGMKGATNNGWKWDLSNTLGDNDFHFYGHKTFNASLGATDTHFDDGGFKFIQNTVNLDFSKALNQQIHLALGAELRSEVYKLYAGEEASYKNYDLSGEKASGAQGFPGYQPSDAVRASRSVMGLYADVEADVTKSFLLDGAVRFENYNDFGSTFNMKLATRLKASDQLNFRGSISSGFRAPSLQQINFSSTYTSVFGGGQIAEVKIAPNYSPITKAAGIPELKQERSVNASIGFAWKASPSLNITVDAYQVKVKDRVVLSGQFSSDDNSLDPALLASMQLLKVSYAQFFANAVNTTNQGIDIVLDYSRKLAGSNSFRGLFTANFQKMTIDKINVPDKLNDTKDHRDVFLSDREQKFILASAPNSKFAFNFEYGMKKFTIGTRFTYFGKVVLLGFGEDGSGINPQVPSDANEAVYLPDQYNYGGKLVSDLYFNYHLTSHLFVSWGADNLLNVHPDLGINPLARGWAFNNETGGPWDAVQMGGNGIRLYARLGFSF